MRQEFDITPVPKPRMTISDKWRKRSCVERYYDFKDQVKAAGISLPDSGAHIIFVIPFPKSWSNKKKSEHYGKPHQARPDKDNLEKALMDAVRNEDSSIWDSRVSKVWGEKGKIIIITGGECEIRI